MAYKVNSVERVHKGRVFSLNRENVTLPNGVTADLDVVRHPGAAAVVPLAEGGAVLLLRQFRHAAGGELWEIPAGTLGPGETPLECARRELAEETGCDARDWRPLGEIVPVPGYSDEKIHLFLVSGLIPAKRHLDRDEIIEVHRMPFRRALEMIGEGTIRDGKTICGLYLARSLMEREFPPVSR
jgi:ADP-ribose pyrophosphatase